MIADKKDPLLRIEALTVHYGAAQALFGVDLAVAPGETVALVGANGAGKTSLLKAVMGLAPPSGGRIFLEGVDVTGSSPAAMAARGVALCPEGREMFGDLTVKENLELGALALRLSQPEMARRLAAVYDRFPQLQARTGQRTKMRRTAKRRSVQELRRRKVARSLRSAVARSMPISLRPRRTNHEKTAARLPRGRW